MSKSLKNILIFNNMNGGNEQTMKGPIIKKFIKDQKKKDTEIKKLYKKNEEDIDKIVDFSDVQKGDIYVNLIIMIPI